MKRVESWGTTPPDEVENQSELSPTYETLPRWIGRVWREENMAIIGMDGNPVEQEDAGVEGKIEVSEQVMAMMGLMLTAEMLYTYAVQQVSSESAELVEQVRDEVSNELKTMAQFNLNDLKFRVVDALQVVMASLAAVYLKASMQAVKDEAEQPDVEAVEGEAAAAVEGEVEETANTEPAAS